MTEKFIAETMCQLESLTTQLYLHHCHQQMAQQMDIIKTALSKNHVQQTPAFRIWKSRYKFIWILLISDKFSTQWKSLKCENPTPK